MRPRQLTHLRGGQKVGEYLLDLPSIIIGRGRSAHIRLDENPVASRQHCVIQVRGDQHVIEDLGGANGTFIEDQRIKSHWLRHGDRIVIGGDAFRYELAMRTARSLRAESTADEGGGAEAISLDHVESLDPSADLARIGESNRMRGDSEIPHHERTAVADRHELERMLLLMKVRSGPHLSWGEGEGSRFVALGEGPFRIGHGPGHGFELPGARLLPGRTPCELVREGHGFVLVPLTPFWNPVRFAGLRLRKARPLQDGDRFQVESIDLSYHRGEGR